MDDDISDISPNRIKVWSEYGVEAIKADLQDGGYRYVGGTPEVRKQAWRWVRHEEARQAKTNVTLADSFIAQPTVAGFGVDLRALWRWFRQQFGK